VTVASNLGTYSEAYATPEKLTNALLAGERGCFRAGIYSEPDKVWNFTK
jgi:hypothetical protein